MNNTQLEIGSIVVLEDKHSNYEAYRVEEGNMITLLAKSKDKNDLINKLQGLKRVI